MDQIEFAAVSIREARNSLIAIPPIRETMGIVSPQDAYAVQEFNTRYWLDKGRKLTGRKIGLTSEAVQQQLGVDQPDFGMLWADLEFSSDDHVSLARFLQPKLEGEIAFVLRSDLDGPDITLDDIANAIAYAIPALEIVDSAIADWNIRFADTVADNASFGGFVLGTSKRQLSELDLRLCGMVVSKNNEQVSLGVGAACLGNPLNAVLWLARKMVEVNRPLRQGDIILSGALGSMIEVVSGDVVTIEIQGFEPVSINCHD